ncbi:hypothetical protein HYH03_002408 [Edaphochlamys debaryana]|uniref:Uncharacterized protein n=1 Tax=Edaphochlamys debaryana TaxID=47281 RepID=A0A835YEK4_9CHLO|nr:hypothetical protein HYH03_002408 [Edaphochlamys debaryana]|eukprot:KAG2499461.1 hypothetical protein HYH03_002408 [Edaphochlamys debaryana]
MSRAQLERWAAEHPTATRTGRFMEPGLGYMLPRVGAAFVVAGALWWFNSQFGQSYRPETLSPEFVAEAKKIGEVATRVNGPPVYLNPFVNKIPGSIRGPEDVKDN